MSWNLVSSRDPLSSQAKDDCVNMGNYSTKVKASWGHYWDEFVAEKEAAPEYEKGPTFDPNFGFDVPRKERGQYRRNACFTSRNFHRVLLPVMVATQEEMEAANLRLHERDYCAHHGVAYRKCMANNMPWYWKCKHFKHEWMECEYEEYENPPWKL